MNANELRKNNLVDWNGEIAKISQLLELEVVFKCGETDLYTALKPIPLTEEILLKCGFELNEDLGDMKYYQIPNEKRGFGVCFDHDEIVFYLFNIKGITNLIYDESFFQHLHQLQNLYFALTGTELEINL
jgi:hypothetical protein